MLFSILLLAAVGYCFDLNSKTNVAVYWGQNSAGTQTRLSDYCTSDVDIVLLSFLNDYPSPLQLNFANQCLDSFASGLLKCDKIGEDIKYCQDQGKVVLLSLGGAVGTYGFSSDSEGTAFADTLWNKFGGGSDDERPFGDAIVDGFDFDLENHIQTGTAALGNALKEKFSQDTSKTYYLSAAPQCPYPDASVGEVMENVELDFAFIQFYNNYCSLGPSFNYDTWQDYAATAPNTNIKLFIGQPAAPSAAGSGYNDPETVAQYVDQVKNSSNFGGISLWDASQEVTNGNYASKMKEALA